MILFLENGSNKRSISSNISDNDEEEYQIQCQTPAKKPKRSSSVDDGLPVKFFFCNNLYILLL